MKIFTSCTLFLLLLFPILCVSQSARDIIEKSIQAHDPDGNWSNAKLAFHFQEPRLQNPQRYSVVKLDNATGAFEMERNRETHTSKHIINTTGLAITLLDGVVSEDEDEIKKYRLEPERNVRYRAYYEGFCGMPMNLPGKIENVIDLQTVSFNEEKCYMIEVKLKEPMFSDHWKIYISAETYLMAGIEIFTNEEATEGERLYFDKIFDWEGMKLTRIRHWHELSDDSYSGSDILVNSID